MISVAEAEARVLAGVRPVGIEPAGLHEAAGRVLAEAIAARRRHPPRDVSAMDGFAVRAADAAAVPATLRIAMRIQAGEMPARTLQAGEAARIFTGAALPDGADAIVIQEDTTSKGDCVTVLQPAIPGRHVRRAGYDFKEGETLLAAGRRLTAQDCGLIAAANVTGLSVFRRPRVALLATGDELVPPGITPEGAQIVASNGVALAAMVAGWGGEAVDLGIAGDDEAVIRAAARPGLACDVLVTQGGASVGDADLVKPALLQLGFAVDFWKIAMRPGKPLMFGRIGATAVIGLPGNPVSALVCARLFLEPLLRRLGGETWRGHRLVDAVLGSALPANDQRQDHLRAFVELRDGRLTATAFPLQDSGNLSTFARADALILRQPHAPAAVAGEPIRLLPLASWL